MNKFKFSDKFRKALIFSCIVICILSSALAVYIFFVEPYQNKSDLDEIKDIFYDFDSKIDKNKNGENLNRGNVKSLLDINSDIKGWIKIDETPINYPVLQSSQEKQEFYLHRNYKKAESSFGSIFLDCLCSIDKPSKNLILYGHSMRDGSMFAYLLKYNDLNFYKNRPIIIFDTLNKQADWKIISVFKTNTLDSQGPIFNYLKIDFNGDSDFLNYIYDIKIRSLLEIPVNVNKNDDLITLSTCSYELPDFRTVVVARKVREGESKDVDVSKAAVSKNPLMPSGYYAKYGGKMPNYNGFEKDFKDGKIDWYVD